MYIYLQHRLAGDLSLPNNDFTAGFIELSEQC